MSEDGTINITSINQSGGITAYQVIIGNPQRELTEEFTHQLDRLLEPYRGRTITLNATAGDSEAYQFATKIYGHLVSRQWSIPSGVGMLTINPPIIGMQINAEWSPQTVWVNIGHVR